ncbi:MAG TPA: tetratricopeptide repeat protein [Gemmataceae bacterium]|nr:tetratricopeptide repeat protein [Gemmataceae bacterium]
MRLMALVVAMLIAAEKADDLLAQAEAALEKGQAKEALALADKAVELQPKSGRTRFVRGLAQEALRKHTEAVADFDKALDLDDKLAEAYDHRGSERFKLGQVKESLADFDKYLELRPEAKNSHWKRGISLYYAGKFEEGRKQFEGYEKVDTNDVENAVWHYLCNARAVGVEKARAAMLKIGKDKRVPMMEVYALYAGKAKPDDVLTATRAGNPRDEDLKHRLFYAHLYLGLYYEAEGDKKKALEHITKAADDYPIGHYMGDVARVHRDLLKKEK